MVVQTKAEPDGLPPALQRWNPALAPSLDLGRVSCSAAGLPGLSAQRCCWDFHGVTESEWVWVGRDFKNHPVPPPCHGQGHVPVPQVAPNPSAQPGLDTSRDGAATAPLGSCPTLGFPRGRAAGRGAAHSRDPAGHTQPGLEPPASGAGVGAAPAPLPGAAPAGSHGGSASPAAAGLQLPACRGGAGRGAAGSAPGEHRERGAASAGPAEPSRAGADGSGAPISHEGQDERGDGAQRGEPQHSCHEQPWHLAVLRAGHRAAARRAPEHPLLQRPCGLDSHQHHPQPEHVHLPAHREGNPLRDPGPGQGPAAHALGADGLRSPVHRLPQVPHHYAHRPVFSNQLLHQVRPDTLHHQHHLPDERADPQTASAPRSADLWDQQVLSGAVGWGRGGGFSFSPAPLCSPHADWAVVRLFKRRSRQTRSSCWILVPNKSKPAPE